jgi:hypothetical protein
VQPRCCTVFPCFDVELGWLEKEKPKVDFSSVAVTAEQAGFLGRFAELVDGSTTAVRSRRTATVNVRARTGYPFARVPMKDVTLLAVPPLVVPEPIMLYMTVGSVDDELPGNESEALR